MDRNLSIKQEKKIAKLLDTSLTPGSGSSNWQGKKADSKSDILLVENKYTEKRSFSLKESELSKLRDQAYIQDLEPVFQVSFEGTRTEVAMITMDFFVELLRVYNEHI